MNPKVQIEILRKDLEWLLQQAVSTKQTFNACLAVSDVFANTKALATYGDYFAYSQNMMIGEIQLQLSKLYVENSDSITLSKIIDLSNDLFTEIYYKETRNPDFGTYASLKSKLEKMSVELNELAEPIKNLKRLRNKNLAHFDKNIKSYDDLEEMNQSNPFFLEQAIQLIEFALESLSKCKGIMFNISLKIHHREYTHEIEEIAKAIEFYRADQDKKRGEMIGKLKY